MTSINLCLDFGTAFSKASAWTVETNQSMPLMIGEAAGQIGCNIPTTIFISPNGWMYFGDEANYESEKYENIVFSNLKSYVTRFSHSLDEMELEDRYNPTQHPITIRQVISLYFGYLSHLSMASIKIAAKEMLMESITYDNVRRTITMPVFGGKQGDHLKNEVNLCADYGWKIKDEFDKAGTRINIKRSLTRLQELEHFRHSENDEYTEMIVEPLAAIAARMATYHPEPKEGPRLNLVIDFGAGTVDFGLFPSGHVDTEMAIFTVPEAVYSLPIGGNEIDEALVNYRLRMPGLNGIDIGTREALYENARVYKEELFRYGNTNMGGILISKNEFIGSSEYQGIANKVAKEFENLLNRIDKSWFEFASKRLTHRGITVFLTGGGATLPFLRDMVRDGTPRVVGDSKMFFFRIATDEPKWASEEKYRQAWNRIGRDYAQLAVSIGGSVFGAGVNNHLKLRRNVSKWMGAR